MAYQGNMFDPMRLYSAWVEGYSGYMKLYMESMDVLAETFSNMATISKIGQMKASYLFGKYLEQASKAFEDPQKKSG